MAKIDSILLNSKFRGCLLGGLIGDCLGAPFEGETMTRGSKLVLQKYFDKLEVLPLKAPIRVYTDDTAMTKSVVKCLTDKPAMDFKFLAKLFVKEYFSEPRRGYGQNVVDVFSKLKTSKFENIYKPAQEQFNGMGSYGNGGAMRIAPIALYFYNNYSGMVEAAIHSTEITHSNKLAIHGAVLQCLAIHQSLLMDPVDQIDAQDFITKLIDKMKPIEVADEDDDTLDDSTPYQTKLKLMYEYFNTDTDFDYERHEDEIIKKLGNNISAFGSVPTAIYCFLRGQSTISEIETFNTYRRTIQYAISLGGDTDTIASMAGSIAGAYLGEEYINECMLRNCEFHKEMTDMADNLFRVTDSTSN